MVFDFEEEMSSELESFLDIRELVFRDGFVIYNRYGFLVVEDELFEN